MTSAHSPQCHHPARHSDREMQTNVSTVIRPNGSGRRCHDCSKLWKPQLAGARSPRENIMEMKGHEIKGWKKEKRLCPGIQGQPAGGTGQTSDPP